MTKLKAAALAVIAVTPPEKVKYEIHQNKLLGMMLGTKDIEGFVDYPAYQLKFSKYKKYFDLDKDIIPWCKEHIPATYVFSKYPHGLMLRSATFIVGNWMYSRFFGWDKIKNAKHGKISSGREFLQMVPATLNGKLILYDFVLTKKGKFRMGAVIPRCIGEMAAKHVTLAAGRQEILYAGDMFIVNDIVYLTNNSGTYRPPEEKLKSLVLLFQDAFSDIQIRVLAVNNDEYPGIMKKYFGTEIKCGVNDIHEGAKEP